MIAMKRVSFGDRIGGAVSSFMSAVSPRYREQQAESERRQRQLDWAERRINELHQRARNRRTGPNAAAHWEAADSDRFRGHDWMVSKLSPNTALERWWETLTERSEDLYRNNPYAASAINGRVKNVVGCGYVGQSRIVGQEGTNHEIELIYKRWAKAEKIGTKMRQAERCMGIYGEAFVMWSDITRLDRTIPTLHIQVISPKRIETPPEMVGNKNVRMGVELHPKTREPVAYYVRRGTPGDSLEWSHEYDRIPVARMWHQFEAQFPGQVRGVPWMAPAMPALKDLEDFLEAHLIAEQAAACNMGFVETESDPTDMMNGSSSGVNSSGDRLEEFSPGTMNYLRTGEKIKFHEPNRPGNTLEPFVLGRVREIAAGIDYPYELLTKHFDNSFSGGRLALIDGRIAFKCWQRAACESIWSPMWEQFVDRLAIMGLLPVPVSTYAANPHIYQAHHWETPGWPWVDPDKEVKANTKAVQEGFKTKTQVIAETGGDFEDMLAERTQERLLEAEAEAKVAKRREELGLPPEEGTEQIPDTESANERELDAANS